MKKLLLPAALLLPLISNGQSDSGAEVLVMILIGLAASFGVFILLRQVAVWYFKIDKMLENQEITNHLLDKNNKLLKEHVNLLKSQIELTIGSAKSGDPKLED